MNWFETYISKGWKIIPLMPDSKVPMYKSWNKKYSAKNTRKFLSNNSNANLGLLLGRIVDIEGDTESANEFINEITKKHPHPVYTSQKSVHHLFLNPDKYLTRFVFNHIEFRGKNHHSVLPPSIHEMGTKYEWVNHNDFIIPPLPPTLKRFYFRQKNGNALKPSFVYNRCTKCNMEKPIHIIRLEKEVKSFNFLNLQWLCWQCRKEMGVDVRKLCKNLSR